MRLLAPSGGPVWLPEYTRSIERALSKPVETIVFTPMPEPAAPVEGMTYYDSTSNKLRTYDGSAWQNHW